MTIDERLERLTERHEALAQSMELFQREMAELRAADAAAKERHEALSHTAELLVADGKETGQKIRALAIVAEQNEVRAQRNEARMAPMMDAIASLARAVETHQQRLDGIQGQ
jgi:chromosome segregation ATPase